MVGGAEGGKLQQVADAPSRGGLDNRGLGSRKAWLIPSEKKQPVGAHERGLCLNGIREIGFEGCDVRQRRAADCCAIYGASFDPVRAQQAHQLAADSTSAAGNGD